MQVIINDLDLFYLLFLCKTSMNYVTELLLFKS